MSVDLQHELFEAYWYQSVVPACLDSGIDIVTLDEANKRACCEEWTAREQRAIERQLN